MAKNEVIPVKEISEHKTRIEQLREQMAVIKVTNQDELREVAVRVGEVKTAMIAVKAARDKYIAPAKEIIDRAKADFDPIIKACEEIESILKKKAEVFMVAEQKKEEEEKEKILKDGRTNVETKVEKISNVKEAEKKVKTDHGTLNMSMVDEVIIFDQSLVPEEYYKPRELDIVKINKVAKAGVAIPGVKVEKKPQMGMRAR